MVALDSSPQSKKALVCALSLAKPKDDTVFLISVIPPKPKSSLSTSNESLSDSTGETNNSLSTSNGNLSSSNNNNNSTSPKTLRSPKIPVLKKEKSSDVLSVYNKNRETAQKLLTEVQSKCVASHVRPHLYLSIFANYIIINRRIIIPTTVWIR